MDSATHGWCSTIVFTVGKKTVHKWTHTVQTHVAQGSAVILSSARFKNTGGRKTCFCIHEVYHLAGKVLLQ